MLLFGVAAPVVVAFGTRRVQHTMLSIFPKTVSSEKKERPKARGGEEKENSKKG